MALAATTRPFPADEYHFWRAWYSLLVFALIFVASGIDIAIVTLLVHPIELTLHITDVGFAGINAIPVSIGIAAGYYPAGLFADTFPRRYIIMVGVFIWVLGALIATRADSAALFFCARLLAGIGTGVLWPTCLSNIGDAFPRARRAFALSVFMCAGALGNGLGLTICGVLVEATRRNSTIHLGRMLLLPWQQCFVAVAAIGAVAIALSLTISEPSRKERLTQRSAQLGASARAFAAYLWKRRVLWGLMFLGYAVGLTSLDAIIAWAPAFGTRHFGITGTSPIALLGTFRAGGAILGSLAAGLLAQRSANRREPRMILRVLVAAMVMMAIFAISFPLMPSWLLAVAGIGVVQAMTTLTASLLLFAIMEASPNEVRGQILGVIGILALIPTTLGAVAVAFLETHIFAKAGGLATALAVAGGSTSILAMLSYSLVGGAYESAWNEMRARVGTSESGATT
jgi:MFS family permease